jgi:hypothetical protein
MTTVTVQRGMRTSLAPAMRRARRASADWIMRLRSRLAVGHYAMLAAAEY